MDNLNELKQRDLVAYAEQQGYKRIEAKCSPHSVYLALGDDKIIVKVDGDNHYVYCNVHDDRDQGSIVDFVMKRRGCGYVEAMKTLLRLEHAFFPTGLKKPHSGLSKATEEPDRKKCEKVWNLASWTPEPAYLLGRGLSPDVLNDARFMDTFRVNSNGAVMFLHRDRAGMAGYELRGVDAQTGEKLKGFMKDGKRGLWYSNNLCTSKSVVICESAIDCLSHYELYGWDCAYVSIGGAISMKQKDLLAGLFVKVTARNGLIIIGVDNDAAGTQYFETMQALTPVKLKRHCPIGNDWNADLQFVRSDRHPDVFPTEDSALSAVRNIFDESLNVSDSNRSPIRCRHIYPTVNYRPQGQPGKARTVIIPNGNEGLEERLATIHGKPVKIDKESYKMVCAWGERGMVSKCDKPDIFDDANFRAIGCRNCGSMR